MPAAPHVLIVDDDPEIRDLLGRYLKKHGYRVDTAADGRVMARLLETGRFDLVVLDLMLPGEDGLSLCRRLRATSHLPIIMLTAMGEETDRIVGLEMGADDYLPKPFNPRELLARIKAVLRRGGGLRPSLEDHFAALEFDGWRIDVGRRELYAPDGALVPLTSGEFDLLLALAERPQRVLSRDQLLDLTKGRGAQPFDRSIDVQLSRLRRKVEADPKDPQLIKTVRGGGYVLSACRHSASPRRPGSVDRPMHVVYPVAAPRMLRAGHRSGRVAAVPTPAELRHDLYRQLYFAERSRREQIRSGIAVPVSAIAFSVFAFGKLATHLDLAKWQAPSTILLMLLALGALASVIAAIASLVRVEWLLVFDELPDLTELLRAEKALAGAADRSDPAARRLVDDQFRDLLTGGYFIAYRRAFMSNGASSTYRAWAVRFIVVGLFLLLLAYMVLPVHMAG